MGRGCKDTVCDAAAEQWASAAAFPPAPTSSPPPVRRRRQALVAQVATDLGLLRERLSRLTGRQGLERLEVREGRD